MRKISVCLATYNGENYIKEQIASILPQLKQNDEIIVSDDGSTDNTIAILKSFNDSRIQIFSHVNKTKSKFTFSLITQNFQNALHQASGDIIYLSDQDDIWLPNKVEVCNKLLQTNDLVLHDCCIVDENLELKKESYFEINGSKKGIITNLIKNSYLGCCMAFSSKILNKALPFPNDVPHDIWLGLIGEYVSKVHFESQKLVYYRRHGQNVSASSEKSGNSFMFKINYRLSILKALLKRI